MSSVRHPNIVHIYEGKICSKLHYDLKDNSYRFFTNDYVTIRNIVIKV